MPRNIYFLAGLKSTSSKSKVFVGMDLIVMYACRCTVDKCLQYDRHALPNIQVCIFDLKYK